MTLVAAVVLLALAVVVLGLLVVVMLTARVWDDEHRDPPSHSLGEFLDGGMYEYREARHRKGKRDG